MGRFWGILVAIVLTPYIIGHLGIERYGIWALMGVFTGYFGLLDLGIGSSFVKYIAEYYAKKDFKRINQVVHSGLVCYSILAVLIIFFTFFAIDPLLSLINIPDELQSEAFFIFLLGIIIYCTSNALSVFRAIQGGLQKMDISNKVTIAVSIPNIAGTIFFLERGYGLPGLMVNNAIILAIGSIINIVIAFKILPELRFRPFLLSKEMCKRLFKFGYKLQIARMSSMISAHIDKLLISYFLSLGFVTFYQLASSIVNKTKSVALLFLTALIPAFSEIDAQGKRDKLIEGYIRGTKYLALFATPLFTLVIVLAPQIMMIWMGGGYEKSVLIIQVLGIGWLCAVLAGVRGAIVQAIAKPEMEMKAGLVAAILNLPLSIIFIIKFGFIGVAFGTSIALLISALYGFVTLHREIDLSFRHFMKTSILTAAAICISIGVPLYGVTTMLSNHLMEPGRITSLIILVIGAILFISVYLMALLFIKPLDNIDITLLVKDRPAFFRRLMTRFAR